MKKYTFIVILLFSALHGFAQKLYIYEENDKYGLVDKNGIVKLVIEHDRITDLKESDWSNTSAFLVEKGKKNGLMDYKGNWIYPLIYDQILCQNGNCRLKKNDLFGYGNVKGKVFIPVKYQNLGLLREGKICATLQGKSGYLNTKNKWVIDPIFDPFVVSLNDFRGGRANVYSKKTRKCGYIDEKGKLVIPQIYDDGGDFYHGLASVRLEKNKQGYIDKNGKVVIKLDIDYSYRKIFEYGVVELRKNCIDCGDYNVCDRYIFNTKGENILPENCLVARSRLKENYIVVRDTINKLKGVIDNQGKIIVPVKYVDVGVFNYPFDWINVTLKNSEGYERTGFYDRQGKKMTDCKYNICGSYSDEKDKYICIEKKNGWGRGALDKNGKEILSPNYRSVDLADDVFLVNKDVITAIGQRYNPVYGYYNKDGSELIAPQYSSASTFNNGIAVVKDKKGSKIINKKNEVLVDLGNKYKSVSTFSNGRAIVTIEKNDKELNGLIDRKGKLVVPLIYDYMYHYNDIIVVQSKKNEKYGVIGPNGKVLIPLELGNLHFDSCNGKIHTTKNGKVYWFDKKGNPLPHTVPAEPCNVTN